MQRHIATSASPLVLLCALVACSPSREELQADLDTTKQQLAAEQARTRTLQDEIAALQTSIDESQRKIDDLMAAKEVSDMQLAELRDEQERRRVELATYEALLKRLEKLIDAGTVQISFRKGRMIVELASAVLFDSGKTELKEEGKQALEKLVEAFSAVSNRDLMIAGHTDNVPIKTRRYKSNWELSTQRAVVVVDFMIEKGFPAQHLGAAGYSEFDPVDDNTTDKGRAHNRRIEIQLMPDLAPLKGIEKSLAGSRR
jgi:chemotaxis protein MotB